MTSYYPTHAILPETAKGLLADGVPQPFQPVPVGNGWIHVPILYRDDVKYEISDTPCVFKRDMPDFCCFGAFRDGARIHETTSVCEDEGIFRRATKITGEGFTTRVLAYSGVSAWRVQHAMLVPVPNRDTTDMGFQVPCGDGQVLSNLGGYSEGWNTGPYGPWSGWVACGGTFVSIRHAREKFPRGFKVENGAIRIYQHFENGARVRPDDARYETIAHLKYLHQGKLNTRMPDEYMDALKTDRRLVAELKGMDHVQARDYPHVGLASVLDILVVHYTPEKIGWNGLDLVGDRPPVEFEQWHNLHQRGPVVSLVEVPGMKGDDFVGIERIIKRNLCERVLPYKGQFVFGGYPDALGKVHRCHTPNHYHHVGVTWKQFLRTRDQDYLQRAREYHGYLRDVGCLSPGEFSHGTHSILPWTERSSFGHWVDPDSLLQAWLVDGDRISKEKYDQWVPYLGSMEAYPLRDVKNALVQAERYSKYTGKDLSAGIAATRKYIEAIPYDKHGAGPFQQPGWASKEFCLREKEAIFRSNWRTFMLPAVSVGEPERHFGWLSRYEIDSIRIPDVNDSNISSQWGEYLEALRKKFPNLKHIPPFEEMGDYPFAPSGWSTEIVFQKPDGPQTYRVQFHAFLGSGDPHATSILVKRPDGSHTVLVARVPNYNNGWAEKQITRVSGRDGMEKEIVVDGPAGQYRLLFRAHELGLFGPITGPEYCIVLPGAKCSLFEGWFKKPNSDPIWIRNELAGVVEAIPQRPLVFVWLVGGVFAAKKEWLP